MLFLFNVGRFIYGTVNSDCCDCWLPTRFSVTISGEVTPVPIPNTEVKPTSADGTEVETPWESRTSPDLLFVWGVMSWSLFGLAGEGACWSVLFLVGCVGLSYWWSCFGAVKWFPVDVMETSSPRLIQSAQQ